MRALHADCGACAALCCLALALDRGPSFAIDKAAGAPCPNLSGHLCGIHSQLADRGFSGCTRYDCLGAGQRVVQELFAGRSWQDDPALARPMMAAFADMRAVHERMELLRAAAVLPLDPDAEAQRRTYLEQLDDPALDAAGIAGFGASPRAARIDGFIRGLRRFVA
ncbi:hypothetical protein [Pseudooceanicola aestuarii]|uniref:hypothetical protein n=1 Tax=Pseudooceanicola aestuarii TaxID=2697319 RepID=UPI0013D33934|nr:hypothetical protein [Pseudooceanicola aestuarii]